VCVCVCVYMYTVIYIYMCVCMYIYVCVYIYIYLLFYCFVVCLNQRFFNTVDADIVIGYNIVNFDLPYLLDRARVRDHIYININI